MNGIEWRESLAPGVLLLRFSNVHGPQDTITHASQSLWTNEWVAQAMDGRELQRAETLEGLLTPELLIPLLAQEITALRAAWLARYPAGSEGAEDLDEYDGAQLDMYEDMHELAIRLAEQVREGSAT